MKKIFYFVLILCCGLLCGCNTEMKAERMNVVVEKEVFYLGEMMDLNTTFFVTVVDNNGDTIILNGYDPNGENGYAIMGIDSTVMDTEGQIPLRLQYVVSSNDKGTYYNYGDILSADTSVEVVKPTASEIKSITLKGIAIGSAFSKKSFNQLLPLHCGGSIDVELKNGSKYTVPLMSLSWDILGVDASSDVGQHYNVYAKYCDVTSDSIKVWVIE